MSLIGAPADYGSGGKGAALGPAALRQGGLALALSQGREPALDHGDVTPHEAAPLPDRAISNGTGRTVDGCHHLAEVAAYCGRVRDAVAGALTAGDVPLLVGGDHSLAMGSIAAVAAHCAAKGQPLFVLWLDAHADFNTPQSSPTGFLYGMPVAVATGEGHPLLTGIGHATPMLDVANVMQIGVRSVDPLEAVRIRERALRVCGMDELRQRGMAAAAGEALATARALGAHLHVSFDIDFLDPSVAPGVGLREPDGPNFTEAATCLEMIGASGLLGSFDLVELSPGHDPGGGTTARVISLVERAFRP